MTWSTVLFDLDGTLTDSERGVSNGVINALAAFGIPAPSESDLRKYLGPPLWHSFHEFAGLSGADLEKAVHTYREYYHETGQYENSVYPEIPELLKKLKSTNVQLAVATSKVEHTALSIIEHFQMTHLFEAIVGSDEKGEFRGSKGLVIREAMNRLNATDPDDIVMIGDRLHDVHGARENGVDSIGVLWGYGEHQELIDAGATHIVSDPKQLSALLRLEQL